MKKLLTLVLLITFGGLTQASDLKLTGFAYPFSVERITGLWEADLGKYGCQVTLSLATFESMLEPSADAAASYANYDVRAKLSAQDGRTYFVDKSGNVRQGSTFAHIDTVWLWGAFIREPNEPCVGATK